MSLNPTSLIGVGRVGLRPNSDNVTNFTLFYLKASLSRSCYLFHNVKWEWTNLLKCVNCNFVVKSPVSPLLQQVVVHLARADQHLAQTQNIRTLVTK